MRFHEVLARGLLAANVVTLSNDKLSHTRMEKILFMSVMKNKKIDTIIYLSNDHLQELVRKKVGKLMD
jgi:hypothetical protein